MDVPTQNRVVSGWPKKALKNWQVGTGGWFPRSVITVKVVTNPSSQCSEQDGLRWSIFSDKMGGTTGANLDDALVPSVLY
jgi:hypothetical protein